MLRCASAAGLITGACIASTHQALLLSCGNYASSVSLSTAMCAAILLPSSLAATGWSSCLLGWPLRRAVVASAIHHRIISITSGVATPESVSVNASLSPTITTTPVPSLSSSVPFAVASAPRLEYTKARAAHGMSQYDTSIYSEIFFLCTYAPILDETGFEEAVAREERPGRLCIRDIQRNRCSLPKRLHACTSLHRSISHKSSSKTLTYSCSTSYFSTWSPASKCFNSLGKDHYKRRRTERCTFQKINDPSSFCTCKSNNCFGKQVLCCYCCSLLYTPERSRWRSRKDHWYTSCYMSSNRNINTVSYSFLIKGSSCLTTKDKMNLYRRRESEWEKSRCNTPVIYRESRRRCKRNFFFSLTSSILESTASCILMRHPHTLHRENIYIYPRCENSASARTVSVVHEGRRTRTSSSIFLPPFSSRVVYIARDHSASGSTSNCRNTASGNHTEHTTHNKRRCCSSSEGGLSNTRSSFNNCTRSLSTSRSSRISTSSWNFFSSNRNGCNSSRSNFSIGGSSSSSCTSGSWNSISRSSNSLSSSSSSITSNRNNFSSSSSDLSRSKNTSSVSACSCSSNKRSYSSSSISRNSLNSRRSNLSSSNINVLEDDMYDLQQQERHRIRLPSAGFLRSPDMQIRPLQVVLVGRPNVGKSMLFNRLLSGTRPCTNSRRRLRGLHAGTVSATIQTDCQLRREQLLQQAIVSSQAGTTRDRRIARAVFGQLQLLLVDTGGLEDKDITQASQLLTNMRKQVRLALRDADCVLFVVDATEGITPVDVLLARLVREWLEEDEQQRHVLQHQQGRSSYPEPSAVLTVRSTEKNVGGRPAMQQHHSGGRRLLLLPSSPTSAASAARHPAVSIGPLSVEGSKERYAARDTTARETCSMASVDVRQAVADNASEPEASRATTVTAASDDLPQDFSVPIILVANKADGCFLGSYLSDCYDLNLGSPVIVSAKKNEGFDDLYDRLVLEIGHRQQTLNALWQPAADAEAGNPETERDSGAASTLRAEVEGNIAEVEDPNDEEKYICERVLRPPQPSGEADTWLEGLVRRYGRCGLSESYKQLCDPSSNLHLPWDLSRTSLAATVSEVPAVSSDATEADTNTPFSARPASTRASNSQQAEKVAAGAAEWQQASAGVILPVEQESVSLRSRRNKLKTKEGRDRILSLKRQLLFDETIHLAVIGRPNVGKSTLVNALLGQERMIVSDEPGTTTDSVASDWEYKRHPICLIDTSGVTRGWKVKHTDLLLEAGMQTLRNIRRSQVCILCVDGSAAEASGIPVNAHELALAHLATSKEGRCLVVCVTKWDLVSEQQRERTRTEILERLQSGLGHLKGCPIVFTAAKHGHNLDTLMNRVLLLYRRWNARVPTSKLNAWLQHFLLHFPPPWRLGSRCQIKYLTQVKARPPTFVAWSNVYSAFPVNYQRQLQNAIREEFSLGGTPIRFILRTTANMPTGRRLSKKELLKWRRKTHTTRAVPNKGSSKGGHENEMNDSVEAAASG